jgi:hypothetical protein
LTDRELMQQALEALERCVATCFDAYAHEQVMSKPEHFVNQNITALRERLAQPDDPYEQARKEGAARERIAILQMVELVETPETRRIAYRIRERIDKT